MSQQKDYEHCGTCKHFDSEKGCLRYPNGENAEPITPACFSWKPKN